MAAPPGGRSGHVSDLTPFGRGGRGAKLNAGAQATVGRHAPAWRDAAACTFGVLVRPQRPPVLPQGSMRIGVPFGTKLQISSICASVTAMQPSVQSRA